MEAVRWMEGQEWRPRGDERLRGWIRARAVDLLRWSIGGIFLWFGVLKLFPGLSPAEELAGETIYLMTGGMVEPGLSVPVLGLCESVIGLALVSGVWMRFAVAALLLHMCGTLAPVFLLPDQVFVAWPFVLTMEGQYIAKNAVLISGALVVGVATSVRG